MKATKEMTKITIRKVETIDLDDLYVSKIPEGKKRVARVPMTVGELIEYLTAFDENGIVEYSRGYYGDDGTLTVTTTREETDEEFAERLEILRRVEEQKKQASKNRRLQSKQNDIETLKRLAKKYNLNITEEDLHTI